MPLECGDLLSDAEASTAAQVEVTLRDDGYTLRSLSAFSAAQGGLLTCQWAATGSTGRTTLSAQVLSSATEVFADPSIIPFAQGCDESGITCRWDALVGEYWVALFTSDESVAGQRVPAAWDAATDMVMDRLETAGPSREPWVAPMSGFSFHVCDDLPDPFDAYPLTAASVASDRGGEVRCDRGAFLAGGAWAMDALLRVSPDHYGHMPNWQSHAVEGADAAVVTQGEVCQAILTVGVDAFALSGDHQDDGTGLMTCDAFFAGLSAQLAEVMAAG